MLIIGRRVRTVTDTAPGRAAGAHSGTSKAALEEANIFTVPENLKFTPGRGWFDTTNFTVTITYP